MTGLRTTPGVCGSTIASSPLSFPDDICRSFVKSDKLSRRDPVFRLTVSLAKYPSLFPFGGDAGLGLAMELCPLAELELFLLRPLRSRARCMLMNVGGPPGENTLDQAPAPFPIVVPPNGVLIDFIACGVISIGSSWSSGSIGSPSSELLLESSDPSMLMLPTELEAAILSPLPFAHVERMFTLGESRIMELARGFFDGIIIPFWVMVGEESGDDWSGRVE